VREECHIERRIFGFMFLLLSRASYSRGHARIQGFVKTWVNSLAI
jgi:hypothetical protein